MEIFIEQNNASINENKNSYKLTNVIIFLGLIRLASVILFGAVSAAGLANSSQPKYMIDNQNTGQLQYNGPTTNATEWNYTAEMSRVSASSVIGTGRKHYLRILVI
jgi:hypothetical protein